MPRYARPSTPDEAIALLAEGGWTILAGGTDFYPAQGARPIRDDILDIGAIEALRGIREDKGDIVIGAATSWTEIVRARLPMAFDALKAAAREVGSVQIQNTGTIAGNLCNASPAADGVPALLVLDAEVELASTRGIRRLPLRDFVLGNRRTARAADELVTAIRVPTASAAGRSSFFKLGARRYLVISIAMAAVRVETDLQGRIARCAIAVGACSAVARRLERLEADLVGRPADAAALGVIGERHFDGLAPIDDVRASAVYRMEAAREIVGRALADAFGTTAGQGVAA
ncbi:xanthine dehydrogenase family protein subunit M [Aquibium sp. ELW1220]|uniref:FAD binding domain-containing protein n=1 Tax=Aquibium sp. ELW1220 TaxID=2976766 RepID=UPI0025B0E65C|nr:xanthine dehydrogenase family protein subunit M [Aquibium sp. ELW1220]MDN2583582.1 xanthine dehydrogenase family protein subunit M [Aquibium sp. ELW1220]